MVRDDAVLELQQQLHEKDMKLTEIRLESLSSVHQVEQLRETMNRMKVSHHIASDILRSRVFPEFRVFSMIMC
jgi:hypothetical protein